MNPMSFRNVMDPKNSKRKLIDSMPQVKFRPGVRIRSIQCGDRWKVLLADGNTIEADALCLTLPVYETARFLGSVSQEVIREPAYRIVSVKARKPRRRY